MIIHQNNDFYTQKKLSSLCVVCRENNKFNFCSYCIVLYGLLLTNFVFFHFRFLMVFTCLALSVFSTIDEYEQEATDLLFYLEIVVVIWFSIEFVLR